MSDDKKPLFPRESDDNPESQRELLESTRRKLEAAEGTPEPSRYNTDPLRPPAPMYGPPPIPQQPFPRNMNPPPMVMYGPPVLPTVRPRSNALLIVIGIIVGFAIFLFIGV